jgi:hypothetical protein
VKHFAKRLILVAATVGLAAGIPAQAVGIEAGGALPSPDRAGFLGTANYEVSAGWTQPSVACGRSASAVDVDVSLFSGPLPIAAGTGVDCHRGVATYSSFFQTAAGGRTNAGLDVAPGDHLRAWISLQAGNQLTYRLQNLTQGREVTTSVDNGEYAWGTGAIEVQQRGPLADFGTVTFRNCTLARAKVGNQSAARYDMVTASGVTQAQTSHLTHSRVFTVTWIHE